MRPTKEEGNGKFPAGLIIREQNKCSKFER